VAALQQATWYHEPLCDQHTVSNTVGRHPQHDVQHGCRPTAKLSWQM
jgi:hypothetical protein